MAQRKRKKTKIRTVTDSAARNAATLSDGCNPELVKGADFDGIFEIPIIRKPKKYIIPDNLVSFSEMSKAGDNPNSRGKAEAYEKALGFNKSNADVLIEQIDSAVRSGSVSPIAIAETEFGTKYKYRIPVKGANGQIKNVMAVYQIDKETQIPRMITNFVEKKK